MKEITTTATRVNEPRPVWQGDLGVCQKVAHPHLPDARDASHAHAPLGQAIFVVTQPQNFILEPKGTANPTRRGVTI